MNTQSVDCRRITLPLSEGCVTQSGDFAWDTDVPERAEHRTSDRRYLYIHLPGEQQWSAIHVRRGGPGGERVWGWDGNENRPTLTPSIHHVGVWHGHLVGGRLNSC
jgi:hypothetical protein